jgi:hypothetical protein
MDRIQVIHDVPARTLTVWLEDPSLEHTAQEVRDDLVLFEDAAGRVIGFEVFVERPRAGAAVTVQTLVRTES